MDEMGEEDKVVQTSSYKINNYRDVMYSLGTIVNNVILQT